MSQYYYTVAALPLLTYEGDPPFSLEEFMEHCEKELGLREMKFLRGIKLADSTESAGLEANKTIGIWRNWETALRNRKNALRAARLGVDPELYNRHSTGVTDAEKAAQDAFSRETPLAGEDSLDRARWDFLEGLEVTHFFDLEKLTIYSLKLQLLLRKSFFTTEKGKSNFNEIYESIREEIRSA